MTEKKQHGLSKMLIFLDLFIEYQIPGILPWQLLAAQCWHESRFNPMAVSHAGALGMAQFMPETWNQVGEGNPFDPGASIKAQRDYMLQIAMQFAETEKASAGWWIVGYTWGPNRTARVDQWADIPNVVRIHVKKVLETAQFYAKRFVIG